MNADRVFLALAGLLHDLGKFRQRARWDERRPHEDHGADWARDVLLPKLPFLDPNARERLVAAVRDHHGHPYDRDAIALIVADRLAAGERVEREEEEPGHPTEDPLRSVFAAVRLAGRPAPDPDRYYSTEGLPADPKNPQAWAVVFPVPRNQVRLDYPARWAAFEAAVEAVHPAVWADPEGALTALLALLRAHAWCIPAATWRAEPDVSLYDHLRVTAALAVCIGEQNRETLARWKEQTDRGSFPEEPVALLVGGDLSGIQRFLYAISAAGAAKALRGRSAYLSLIAEVALRFLLRSLDLPPTQVIYSSGGHFYFLAPLSAAAELPDLARRITEALLDAHGGDLAIALDAVPLTGRDLQVGEGRLPQRWGELSRRLGERKAQRFRELLPDRYDRIVGPLDVGGEEARCDVCHAEEAELDRGLRRAVREEEGVRKCSLCAGFEKKLGSPLAREPAWIAFRWRATPPARELDPFTVPARLGLEIHIGREGDSPPAGTWVARFRRADLAADGLPVADFRWLPAYTPLEPDGSIVELEEMAQRAEGAPYWACLRMDVDHLGAIFREGLAERYSLSRVATLSHLLSLFFEGYVPHLVAQVDGGGKGLYLIYAGGDDLLLIGGWDRVLEAAARIREAFRRFTGDNPSLTVSAGITLHRIKFPLYQAAEEAGEALERAKAFRRPDGHAKDAITLFGVTLSWEDFAWLKQWKETLQPYLESPNPKARLSRGFLHKLRGIADLLEEEVELQLRARRLAPAYLPRMVGLHRARWRLVYTLAREPQSLRGPLAALQAELLADPHRMALLRPLSRWLELATRGGREEA